MASYVQNLLQSPEPSKVVTYFHNTGTQQCHLLPEMIMQLKADIADYVRISTSTKTLICRIYSRDADSEFIDADTVLSIINDGNLNYGFVAFPNHFTLLKNYSLKFLKAQVVVKDLEALIKWQSVKKKESLVHSMLYPFGLVKNCVVQHSRHPVFKLYNIVHIAILDSDQDENTVGKLAENTELMLVDALANDYVKQLNSVNRMNLGGFDTVISNFKDLFNIMSKSKNRNFKNYYSKILFTGPTGCGKHSLIKKIAAETKSYLFTVECADLQRMAPSELVRTFEMIDQFAKLPSGTMCVLFLSGLDSVATINQVKQKSLHIVLALLDACSSLENVAVIGEFNSFKDLHPLLSQQGRFIKVVHIGIPDLKQRREILLALSGCSGSNKVNAKKIAQKTSGFSLTDLLSLTKEAECCALNKKICKDRFMISHKYNPPIITTENYMEALCTVKSSVLKESCYKINIQATYWSDIYGMELIKGRLKMVVEWPLLYSNEFVKAGLSCPRGILLFGPSGCGKTKLARVLATEYDATFLTAGPAEIYASFVGDSEKAVTELFRQARLCAPTIIFLDEVDGLVGKRSYSSQRGIQEKVLSTLLNEMDGFGFQTEDIQGLHQGSSIEKCQSVFSSAKNVIVVGATNRIDLIDEALLRPGRFDTILYVPPPNKQDREAILGSYICKMDASNIDVSWLSEETDLFSNADLKNLCDKAVRIARKEMSSVNQDYFISALKYIHPSITRKEVDYYEHVAKKYGSLVTL